MEEPKWDKYESLGFKDELKEIWNKIKNRKGINVDTFELGIL